MLKGHNESVHIPGFAHSSASPFRISIGSCRTTFQVVQIPLDGLFSTYFVTFTTQFGVINLLRVRLIPLSISLIMMLKSTDPSTDPWETLLVNSLNLDIKPLPTCWLWPYKQFLNITTYAISCDNQFFICWIAQPSNPYLFKVEMRMSCRTMSKSFQEAHVDDVSCFSFIYWIYPSIIEDLMTQGNQENYH